MSESAGPAIRPRVWPVFVASVANAILPFLISFAAAALLVLSDMSWQMSTKIIGMERGRVPSDAIRSASSFAIAINAHLLVMSLCTAGIALLGALASPEPVVSRLLLLPGSLRRVAWIPALTGALAVWLSLSMFRAAIQPISASGDISVSTAIMRLLVIALVLSPAHELLFHGYVQPRLCQRWGDVMGVVLTALLASVLQQGGPRLPWHFYPTAFVSYLYMGCVTLCFRSVRVAIVMRSLFAALMMALPLVGIRWTMSPKMTAAAVIGLLAVAAVAIACLTHLRRLSAVGSRHAVGA